MKGLEYSLQEHKDFLIEERERRNSPFYYPHDLEHEKPLRDHIGDIVNIIIIDRPFGSKVHIDYLTILQQYIYLYSEHLSRFNSLIFWLMQKNNHLKPRFYYDTCPLTMSYYTTTAGNLQRQSTMYW